MKSTRITPNLIGLTKYGLMNAYLVREDDGFTLVDTAMNAAEEILAAASTAGAPITRIVLTHGHGDHVGSLDALTAKLGGAVPVSITDVDARLLAREKVALGPNGHKRGFWPTLKTSLGGRLAPGDRVGSLTVVPCPGHTPGHVAFSDTRDGTLIAGDAYSSVGGLAVPSRAHLRFPLPYLATCDRPQALESARALRALNPTVLALGHGPALTDPAAAMDAAIATAARG